MHFDPVTGYLGKQDRGCGFGLILYPRRMKLTPALLRLVAPSLTTTIAIVCIIVGQLGCSSASTTSATSPTDTSGGFKYDIQSVADASAEDVVPLDSANADAASACPGGAACPCSKDLECDSGICIETRDGKQCARLCNGNCPDGLTCSMVTGSSGDNITICLDRAAHLCDPCSTDADCQALGFGTAQALCIDQGAAGHFCGIPCAENIDCPNSYACADVTASSGKPAKQCQREPDQVGGLPGLCPCSKVAITHKLSTTCLSVAKDSGGQIIGQCPGVRMCDTAGLTGCNAPPAAVEVCDGLDNDCNGTTDDAACDDKNGCTSDICKPGSGCSHTPSSGPCDADGNACTVGDACDGATCVPGKAKACDDQNPCTIDSCNPKSGCVQAPDDGAPCTDDNPCTIGDLCKSGECAAGKPKTCTSTDICMDAKCNMADGACKYTAILGCTGTCVAGQCPDDGNPCTAVQCVAGQCQVSFTAAACDDGNPCTSEQCSEGQCKSAPSNGDCLVGGDSCKPGACQAGACVALGAGKDCNDSNPCTDDGCSKTTGACTHSNNSAPCDDGHPCTSGDACSLGGCKSGTPLCKVGDPCQGDSDCAEGQCIGGVCSKPAISCGPVGQAPKGILGDLVLDKATTIDTDSGIIDASGTVLVAPGAPGVFEVLQANAGLPVSAPPILVFDVKSLKVLPGVVVKVTGKRALAFAAVGSVTIQGTLQLSGIAGTSGATNAPGSKGLAGAGGWDGGGFVVGIGCASGNGMAAGPGGAPAGSCGGGGGDGGEGSSGGGGGGGGGGCGGSGGGGGGRSADGTPGDGGAAGSAASNGVAYSSNAGGTPGSTCQSAPGATQSGVIFGDSNILAGGTGGAAGGFGGFAGFGGAGKSSKGSGYGGTPGYAGGPGGGGGGGGALLLCGGTSVTVASGAVLDVGGGLGGVGSGSALGGNGKSPQIYTTPVPATGGGGGSGRSGAGGGGGGGAGGIVWLIGTSVVNQGSLLAKGGLGGSAGSVFGSGGMGATGAGGGASGGSGGGGGNAGKGGAGAQGWIRVQSSTPFAVGGTVQGKLDATGL